MTVRLRLGAVSAAITLQPQAQSRVQARRFRLVREEILAHENVFITVAVEVRHVHAEYGR